MMKRNWIVLVFALLALASCSVEKRVYQPGYYIQWNHFAKQDASRDVAQDASRDASQDVAQDAVQDAAQDAAQDASRDVAQDVAQDAVQDAAQDATQDASRDLSENLSKNLSENLETDVSQDASRDVLQDASRDVLQDASRDLSENLSMNLSENLDLSEHLSEKINSDLEFVLLIILALFLPALTVFLLEGFSKNFWIALLLMAVADLLPFSSFVVRGLIVAIATILAIAVVFHYM